MQPCNLSVLNREEEIHACTFRLRGNVRTGGECFSFKTMTMASFNKIGDREAAIRKLERIAAENLHNTLRLLRHNKGSHIHVYRFSSKLIPLATHEDLRIGTRFRH